MIGFYSLVVVEFEVDNPYVSLVWIRLGTYGERK
jgi:hypothetical protein